MTQIRTRFEWLHLRAIIGGISALLAYSASALAQGADFRHPHAAFSFAIPEGAIPVVSIERSASDDIDGLEVEFDHEGVGYTASQHRRREFLATAPENLFTAFESSVSKTFGIPGVMTLRNFVNHPAAEIVHDADGFYARSLLIATEHHLFRFSAVISTGAQHGNKQITKFFSSIEVK